MTWQQKNRMVGRAGENIEFKKTLSALYEAKEKENTIDARRVPPYYHEAKLIALVPMDLHTDMDRLSISRALYKALLDDEFREAFRYLIDRIRSIDELVLKDFECLLSELAAERHEVT